MIYPRYSVNCKNLLISSKENQSLVIEKINSSKTDKKANTWKYM